ncbi:hypothetical protein ACTMSW_19525 [Micromonospora sp. BQ11]|uniref:hypothetical protein n=1 Tax=Micromonospora sp. BQ11 TaxID=3452212 RepID=UPI003F89913C
MSGSVPEDAASAPAPQASGESASTTPPQDPVNNPPAQAEASRQSDSEQEEEIPPGSLRVDPRVGEDLYGTNIAASYAHVSATGVNAFGSHNTIVHITYHGQPDVKPVIRRVEETHFLEVYAGTEADSALSALLAEGPIACLTGRPHTGRFSTACAALARRHDVSRLHEVLLPDEIRADALRQTANRLEEDHGYLLRLPGDGHVEAMRLLTDVFRRRSASLLLIRDDESRAGDRHPAEVPHHGPDPVEVFRKHLRHQLCDRADLNDEETERHVEIYLQDGGLTAAIKHTYRPHEVVRLAKAVADHHPADHTALAEIVQVSQPNRRDRAAEILRCRATGGDRRPRRADQHERAFRIAYAVFARQPLHHVFEAASLLLEEIDGQAKRPDWGRMALQYTVSELLGPLDVDWREGQKAARALGGVSRSAWLRDGAMRGAIIDEAWHEFDSTRPALLKWLDTLVASDDEPVRRAAAEAAGLLAHHDFDRVCADLIDGWAASPRPLTRRAAARAVVAADMGGQVHHLVRRRVRAWSGGHRNYQRDAAALVYASGLQQPDLNWSLADLRRIARDRMQQHSHAVAEGIHQLYALSPGWEGEIVSELARWLDDRQLRRHAGNALLSLAQRTLDDRRRAPFDLMTKLASNQVDANDLARLWRGSLFGSPTSHQTWPIFGRWLHQAESDDTFRKSISALVADLAAVPALRRRLQFHLVRLAEFPNGLPDWLETAMREQ